MDKGRDRDREGSRDREEKEDRYSSSSSSSSKRNGIDEGDRKSSSKTQTLSWLKKDNRGKTTDPSSSTTTSNNTNNNKSGSGSSEVYLPPVKFKTLPNIKVDAVVVKPGGGASQAQQGKMIEVWMNDRLGRKVMIKCHTTDTVGTLKRLAAAKLGTRYEKIRLQKWHSVLKDPIQLGDYEIGDGSSVDLYYM